MGIHIISNGFGSRFNNLLYDCNNTIKIVSPFVGRNTAAALAEALEGTEGIECTLITRFYRQDFTQGSSSIDGLERLIHAGVHIYALQELHSKLYIFDDDSVITGSANFTFNGFYKNHEFGMFMEQEPAFAKQCSDYFTGLLESIKRAGNSPDDYLVTLDRIKTEKSSISSNLSDRKAMRNGTVFNEKKWGAILPPNLTKNKGHELPSDVGMESDFIETILKSETSNFVKSRNTGIWVKFEGNSEDRIPNDVVYMDRKLQRYERVQRTFFRRRPIGIKEGQVMFMSVISTDEKGKGTPIIIGYANAGGFQESNVIDENDGFYVKTDGRYPYFIELKDGHFLKAPIVNGISLLDLCRDLKHDLYPTFKKNDNTILTTHHQKSHIQITEVAKEYLINKLEDLFKTYGKDTF